MQKIFKSFDEAPAVLSATELAQVLGISRAGAYKLLHCGNFPTLRVGARLLAPKSKVLEWIERCSSEGGVLADG